jgi:outer membrane assembly lipoprotein YfiO
VMHFVRGLRHWRVGFAALCILAVTACQHEFDPKLYPQTEQLFAAGLKEYNAKHWENAVAAFDQLTRALPARDPLLPLSYYYLGKAQDNNGDHLLAAQSFSRVAEGFPEDSLAPRAMLESGHAYANMWRKPQLDPEYGQLAIGVLDTLLTLYPDSPLVPSAKRELAKLNGMLAEKDYETGYHYVKRHAYDSAIIYFKDVLRLHPETPAARKASLKLYDAYQAIKYIDDARDLCQAMLKTYPHDQEVIARCGSGSSAAASTPHT